MKSCFLLLMALAMASVLRAQSPISYGNNKSAGQYAHVNGIDVYYETYGQGEPLLLLHGNGGSISAFSNNIGELSKNFKVIAMDSRAQGKTIDQKDSLSFEMIADDGAALLQTLKVDSAFVLGWSDGGIVGLLMAIRHPQMVRRLMITGANLWPDSTAIVPWLWKEQKSMVDTVHTQNFSAKEKNDWKLFMLDWLQPNITLAQLQTIRCPTLVIGGDRDVIRVEHTVLIEQNIPNGFLWIVPNSGHATLIQHKDEFNNKAKEFFASTYKRR